MAERTRPIRDGILRALDHPRTPFAIVVAGLLLRTLALFALGDLPLDGDASSYHLTASAMIGRDPWEPDWPPGLPAYLAIGYTLFGAKVIVGRALMIPLYIGFSAALF